MMPVSTQIKVHLPENFFNSNNKTDPKLVKRKLRIIIKEKGGNWQDTVLRCEEGLPAGTEWVMNCYPGSRFPHSLVKKVGDIKNLADLDKADPELRELFVTLQTQRNTSPAIIASQQFAPWYRFVNEKLWFKFHKLKDEHLEENPADPKLVITEEEWNLYHKVNKKYAKALVKDIVTDVLMGCDITFDINWLHDSQLMLVFHYLNKYLSKLEEELNSKTDTLAMYYSQDEQQRLSNALPAILKAIKTSYFHHIPWPDHNIFTAEFPIIANNINTGKEVVDGLLSSRHVAFHTPNDVKHFLNCVQDYYPEAEIKPLHDQHVKIYLANKEIDACVNPIGTDYDLFANNDLSDQSIIQYLGKLLNVNIDYKQSPATTSFALHLAQLIKETKKAYMSALINVFVKKMQLTQEVTPTLKKLLTVENLQKTEVSQIKDTLISLLNLTNVEEFSLVDKLVSAIKQANYLLQQAHSDLLSDFLTLQKLRQFKNRKPEAQLFTSIGRLDPEKNVPIILDAYLAYLKVCVASNKPINNSLLIFLVPSRLEVAAYQNELNSILEKFEAIKTFLVKHNQDAENFVYLAEEDLLRKTLQNPGKTPSKPKLLTPNAMSEFYRLGSIIVSSRADGMNLVVKEWISAQEQIIKNCLLSFFEYIKNAPQITDRQALTKSEAALFTIYARALQTQFTNEPQLDQVLTKLSQSFTLLSQQFFKQYTGVLPSLPMLSKNAGAVVQLKQALIVDPLSMMSFQEQFQSMDCFNTISRIARALALRRNVKDENGKEWRRDIIDQVLADETLKKFINHTGTRFAKNDSLIFINYEGVFATRGTDSKETWPIPKAKHAILNLLKVSKHIVFITELSVKDFEHYFWGGSDSAQSRRIPLTIISLEGAKNISKQKAEAAQELLAHPSYNHIKHIAFLGDAFGQPEQPGTDYPLAAWINTQNATYESCVIQVMPYEKRETDKQLLTSLARPNILLNSPEEAVNMLSQIYTYALEEKSRCAYRERTGMLHTKQFIGNRLSEPKVEQIIEERSEQVQMEL